MPMGPRLNLSGNVNGLFSNDIAQKKSIGSQRVQALSGKACDAVSLTPEGRT
jgi:hypothetical protein